MPKDNYTKQKEILLNLLKNSLDKILKNLEQKTIKHFEILSSSKEITDKSNNILSIMDKKINFKKSLKKTIGEIDFVNYVNKDAYNNKNNIIKKNVKDISKKLNKVKQSSKEKNKRYFKNDSNNYLINFYSDNINIISNLDKIRNHNISNNSKFSLRKVNTMHNLYKNRKKFRSFYNNSLLIQNQTSKNKSNNNSIIDPKEIIYYRSVRKKSISQIKKNISNTLNKKETKVLKIIRKKTPCKIKNEKKKKIKESKIKNNNLESMNMKNNENIKILNKEENLDELESKIINELKILNSNINKKDEMIINYNLNLGWNEYKEEAGIINNKFLLNTEGKNRNSNNNDNNKLFHIEEFIDNEYFNYILDYLSIEDLIKLKKVSKLYNNIVIQFLVNKLEKRKNKFIKMISYLEIDTNIDNIYNNNQNISFVYFYLSKTSEKAIKLLNDNLISRLFYNIKVPHDDILLIYRIFFNIINHPIKDINSKEKEKFWDNCRNYFLTEGEGKIGNFLFDIIKNKKICLSRKNIYDIYNLVENNLNKINPSYFSKICGTTGLFAFFVKDVMDFIGINDGKNKSQNAFIIYNIIVDFLNEKINKLKRM